MSGRKNNTKSGRSRFSLFYGRLRLHPLFLLLGLWATLIGEFAAFLCAVLCAVLHEFAHAAQAAKLGYTAKQLTLMPYGATVSMDLEDAAAKDELSIALAGPLCNLLIAALFLALWWCFPSTYPYTETAFYSSLSLGLCNLLPALPLDGGRVVYCALYSLFNTHLPPSKSKKYALVAGKILTVLCCIAGITLFVFFLANGQCNLTLVIFTLFLALGLFEKQATHYVKLDFSDSRAFERGTLIKHVAISSNCTIKKAISFLGAGHFLVLDVYDEKQRFLGCLTQTQLSDFFQRNHLYTTLAWYFS